jgi:hypothetical protein
MTAGWPLVTEFQAPRSPPPSGRAGITTPGDGRSGRKAEVLRSTCGSTAPRTCRRGKHVEPPLHAGCKEARELRFKMGLRDELGAAGPRVHQHRLISEHVREAAGRLYATRRVRLAPAPG